MVCEDREWTVEYHNGQHSFPLSDAELISAIQANEIQFDMLASHPRHTSGLWIRAGSVPEIKRLMGIQEPTAGEQNVQESALVPAWRIWAAGFLSVLLGIGYGACCKAIYADFLQSISGPNSMGPPRGFGALVLLFGPGLLAIFAFTAFGLITNSVSPRYRFPVGLLAPIAATVVYPRFAGIASIVCLPAIFLAMAIQETLKKRSPTAQ